jgi:hypothetical protein
MVHDEQVANLRQAHDREMAYLNSTYAGQIEELTELLSVACKEQTALKNMFVATDQKFNDYVRRSERFIREKEAKLGELQREVS